MTDDDPSEPTGPAVPVGAARAVGLATAVTVLTALPMFLVGSLSLPLRTDLVFGPTALGGAIGVFRASGALAAGPLGRVADRIGAARAMRRAVAMAVVGTLGIAFGARSWGTLAVGLALCGSASSFGQTAANRYLIRVVKERRQGLAFGVKQAAMPTGSMLAGVMVPVLGLTLGWRSAFVASAVLGITVLVLLPKPKPGRPTVPAEPVARSRSNRLGLIVVTIALMCGMAAASTLAAFTVESAAAFGLDLATAAWLLTFGSVCAIAFRVFIGFISDRMVRGHLHVVSAMLGVGSLGYLLLGVGRTWTLVTGTMLAFALGWGFNGLFWFAIVRLHRDAPGAVTGLVMPGGMTGGVIGPILFGTIVEASGFSAAWFTVAAFGALAAVLMQVGRRLLLREAG